MHDPELRTLEIVPTTSSMASIVEATSLQAVTELASNPPAHPNTRIQSNTQPLVLYIARVPGSRDVFLTPIKPREKVVTAEDVQSSLYYVHVNCNDDYPMETPRPPRSPSSVDTNASQLSSLTENQFKVPPPLPKRPSQRHRAPLPYPDDDVPTIQTHPPSPPILKAQLVTRKPIVPDATNISSSHQPYIDLPALPSRPLPTPPADEHPYDPKASLHEDNVRLLRKLSHDDEHVNPYTRDYTTHPETLKQLEVDARPTAGSFTIIRRDPGSSDQWNVASVHDPPVQEVSSSTLVIPTASRRTKKGGAPLYLDITNPAYAQFITNASRSDSRLSTSSSASSDTEPAPEGVFRRRLYMPGSRFAEHGYSIHNGSGHRKHFSLSSNTSEELMRKTMRARHSVDMGSVGSPTADRRSKGYTFTSPWDARCEFSTGATGRTLKCRHYLPPNQGGTREVSELRFNLPTSSRPPLPSSKSSSSYFNSRRHLFSRSEDDDGENGPSSPTIVVNEDGRIDLSLGQEKAGGGFGGKQAKLGKLVIEPEGVKMLDLLVAANVGLWWRAWERV